MILLNHGGRIVPRALNLTLTKEICALALYLAFETTDGCFCTLVETGSESLHLSGTPGSRDVWLNPVALNPLCRYSTGRVTSIPPPLKNLNTAFFIFTISGTFPWANQLSDEFAYGSISPSGRLFASLSPSQASVQSSGPNLRPGLIVKQTSCSRGGSLSHLTASGWRNAPAQHVGRLRNGAPHQTLIRSITAVKPLVAGGQRKCWALKSNLRTVPVTKRYCTTKDGLIDLSITNQEKRRSPAVKSSIPNKCASLPALIWPLPVI